MDIKEKENDQTLIHVRSLDTDATTLNSEVSAVGGFNPGKALNINARGIALVGLSGPSKEMKIAVTDAEGNLAYTSTRAKLHSGDAVLSNGTNNLVATKYFFGPGRDPVMYLIPRSEDVALDNNDNIEPEYLGSKIKTKSSWTSCRHLFMMSDGKWYEWRYVKEASGAQHKEERMLVLYEKLDNKKGRKIAQLVRNDETRTPQSKKLTAGNGGELVLDAELGKMLREPIIVATCLLMLKKEIDRRRGLQYAVLAVAASSVGGA